MFVFCGPDPRALSDGVGSLLSLVDLLSLVGLGDRAVVLEDDGAGPEACARSATRGLVVGRRAAESSSPRVPGGRGRFEAIASSPSTWASRERRTASTRRGGRAGAAWPRCRACARSRRRRPRGGPRRRRPVPVIESSIGSERKKDAGKGRGRRSRPTPPRPSSSSSS